MNTVNVGSADNQKTKNKVIFVMGATATGKSKLSIDLATHFHGEVINSDKIQVYKGLDIITNKVTVEEARGVPHHLLGIVNDSEEDFTVDDFCHNALEAIYAILKKGKVPIIGGGSNSYLEKLVEDPTINFRQRFDCCFIWVDASLPVLHERVGKRIDQMVIAGLLDEVREMFVMGADYNRGIRRAIGAPELESYFMVEKDTSGDEATKSNILANAIEEIKANTRKLVDSQLGKIHRLKNELGWDLHRVDVTSVYEKCGKDAEVAWEQQVLKESLEIVGSFLN
ncbi:adenylate isopentenyltransferase 5, chloroplastic-like [Durio zibethinus]|uniref:adenylate dimethylallyltransferase (ADP/ATP-dependent) n=1 Tax=Durio zibethinus TaxID=66656 RepID=A0A6P5Y5E8_DURZI|nr:adenylate isopentenyltransferase 5, chloroplastic-like [Durio zibethinus]